MLAGIILLATLPWLGNLASQETSAAPASTPATLEDVNRTLSRAKSVFSHFEQERHLALFNEPLRSEGFLCFEQPSRLRWEVTKPYKSILLSDGSGVAQFEWVDEQWKKLDVGLAAAMQNVIAQIAGVMKGQYARENREYSVSLTNLPAGAVVTLIPRNEKMRKMMSAIEVQLAPDLKGTRQVVLREKGGDYTAIRFDEQAVNVELPRNTFDRQSPAALEEVRKAAEATGSKSTAVSSATK